uniref:HTH CENPB-type domain-containing protein n=1 Tax=Strongyloides venezuelensis TaxID=75913 RepID=A0A0K0FZG9_STRVS
MSEKIKVINDSKAGFSQRKLADKSRNIPVTGALLQEKALTVARSLQIDSFEASNVWLDSFKCRHNIKRETLHGEKGGFDKNVIDKFRKNVLGVFKDYMSSQIFNIDETALYYKCLSSKSLINKSKESSGVKMNSSRITICLCVSFDGMKCSPLIIRSSRRPGALEKFNLDEKAGFLYRGNKAAWMTKSLFQEYLIYLDNYFTKKNLGPVALILNNCELQPLDITVNRIFKMYYKKNLQKIISLTESCENNDVNTLLNSITLHDVVRFCIASLGEISERVVIIGFEQAFGITIHEYLSHINNNGNNHHEKLTDHLNDIDGMLKVLNFPGSPEDLCYLEENCGLFSIEENNNIDVDKSLTNIVADHYTSNGEKSDD